MKITKKEF